MMRIVNLTPYLATATLCKAGVVDAPRAFHDPDTLASYTGQEAIDYVRREVNKAYTFMYVPPRLEIERRVEGLMKIVRLYADRRGQLPDAAIVDAPALLVEPLTKALRRAGVLPLYAVGEWMQTDVYDPDTGETHRVDQFISLGFVELGEPSLQE